MSVSVLSCGSREDECVTHTHTQSTVSLLVAYDLTRFASLSSSYTRERTNKIHSHVASVSLRFGPDGKINVSGHSQFGTFTSVMLNTVVESDLNATHLVWSCASLPGPIIHQSPSLQMSSLFSPLTPPAEEGTPGAAFCVMSVTMTYD